MIKRLTIFYRDGSKYVHRNVQSLTDDVHGNTLIIDRGQLSTEVDGHSDIQNHVIRLTTIERNLVSGYMIERVDQYGEDVITVNRISKALSVKPFVANKKKTKRK